MKKTGLFAVAILLVLAFLFLYFNEKDRSMRIGNAQTEALLAQARQLVVVWSEGWDRADGRMQCFERRSEGGPWSAVGGRVTVCLGAKGLAWDREYRPEPADAVKREGDGKSPAGLFRLTQVFAGNAQALPPHLAMPVLIADAATICVDDPSSKYYNTVIDRDEAATVDWSSHENMLRSDELYDLGLTVAYNEGCTPGAGSCIFMHIRRPEVCTTAGCTAMERKDLLDLVAWLKSGDRPVLLQLPRDELLASRLARDVENGAEVFK